MLPPRTLTPPGPSHKSDAVGFGRGVPFSLKKMHVPSALKSCFATPLGPRCHLLHSGRHIPFTSGAQPSQGHSPVSARLEVEQPPQSVHVTPWFKVCQHQDGKRRVVVKALVVVVQHSGHLRGHRFMMTARLSDETSYSSRIRLWSRSYPPTTLRQASICDESKISKKNQKQIC